MRDTHAPTESRAAIRALARAPEGDLVDRLAAETRLAGADRAAVAARGADLVRAVRARRRPGLMEAFLAEYGLSTTEGLALMCLAEALLRVPDPTTIDALIADKVGGGDWIAHFARSGSAMVNASTLGLALAGGVLRQGENAAVLRDAARRLGRPVIRAATARAMREMGTQFVLGETMEEAMRRARADVARGIAHSYDMLGEAAMTAADAAAFRRAYAGAIDALAGADGPAHLRPSVSVKLSALHPRYEATQPERIAHELAPRLLDLCRRARDAGVALTVDAEEADRLEPSLDLFDAVLTDPALDGWDGFGVVVQAYGKRATAVIDWLHARAAATDRRIAVRLVKGAYWDAEIKRAQVEGLPGFPVFTRKAATDVSYLACARRLLDRTDRLRPQFATHNAHSIAAILHMARDAGLGPDEWELQRLHGMGEALHDVVRAEAGTALRIYAPVGRHRDLLAYLVRRLLENGANGSFVNQLTDASVPPEAVAADPFDSARRPARAIVAPRDLFAPRVNARGWDPHDPDDLSEIDAARMPHRGTAWTAAPILAEGVSAVRHGPERVLNNPADPSDVVGRVTEATADTVAAAHAAARPWDAPAAERAAVLREAADRIEAHFGEAFALLAREAGKTLPDAIAELREAVDFLRYYADHATDDGDPRGTIAVISPWNFPLAIFTGQTAAPLAAGCAVLTKPAEPTPLIAAWAVRHLHAAGVPRAALQLLPGEGGTVGAALVAHEGLGAAAFTGSTATAQRIARAMAGTAPHHAPLVAETGGLNAMVADSTALPEQVVRDLVTSAFQSAGQRCSATRIVYLQEDTADGVIEMLTGAMAERRMGDPWNPATDIGPVITDAARDAIEAYVERARQDGRLLARGPARPGRFVAPALIRVDGIADMDREVFGPVLHVATWRAGTLDAVIDGINAAGYGLTFGVHSRIDATTARAAARVRAGNVYVNRNQIGAIVGSQPFGGEGLSGTGPKAGGPRTVARFRRRAAPLHPAEDGPAADPEAVQRALDAAPPPGAAREARDLPGPTGETNRLSVRPRGPVLCLGPGEAARTAQVRAAEARGCAAVRVDGPMSPEAVARLRGMAVVAWWGDAATGRALRAALAERDGPLLPLSTEADLPEGAMERHVCTDTTAAGGNATLLGAADGP